jgi:ABC-2 type transport system permease protein
MKKIFWIALREFLATVWTKAFLFGLLFLPFMIGVVAFAIGLMADDDFRAAGRIALIDPTGRVTAEARQVLADDPLAARLAEEVRERTADIEGGAVLEGAAEAIAELDLAPDFTLVQLPADADLDAEKAMLLSPDPESALLALIVIHANAIEEPDPAAEFGSYDVYTAPNIDDRESSAVQSMLREAIVNLRMSAYGFERASIERLTRIAGGQAITVTETEERESFEGLNFILPMAFMFLLFMGIMGGGQGLMTSTIEEKSSRVVEVLLSAVSPMELMAGKLIGYMGISLLGMSIYLIAGLFVLSSFSLFGLLDPMLILYLFLFFFVAFFTVGSFMMAIGAAVNELRETQSLMMPVMILLMLPWFLWMPISRDPNSTLSVVASFLPPVNTFGMMLRLSSTEPPPAWQVWASIGVGIVGVYCAVWFAARVFRIGLLLTGKPPDLRTLIRWIRM